MTDEHGIERASLRTPGGYDEARSKSYVTAKEIVIPAGTPVGIAAWKTERAIPFAQATVGPTKDTCFDWTMPLDEAIELGLVAVA